MVLSGVIRAYGQESIEVKIEPRPSSQGVQSAFEVIVPQATADDAIKLWKKTITKKGVTGKSPKVESIKDEWVVKNIVLNEISTDQYNVYTQVSSFPDNIYVRVFLQNPDGFLGSSESSAQATEAAAKYVRNYAVDLYKQAVGKELKGEENKLKGLERDYNKMNRQNRSYDKKVNKAAKEERSVRNDLQDEKKLLKEIKKSDDTDLSADEKSASREEIEKSIKAANKDIKKAQKSQSKFEKKINKNEKAQNELQEKIVLQKEKVNEVKRKLNNIR